MMFTAPAIDPSLLIKTSVPGIRSHSMMSMFPPSILAMFNVMSRDCMSIAFLIDVLRLANGGHRSWKAIAGGVFLGDDVVRLRFVCVCVDRSGLIKCEINGVSKQAKLSQSDTEN